MHEELRTSRRQGNSDNVVVLERRFLLSVAKAVALVDELDTVLVELGSQRGVQRGQRGLVRYNHAVAPFHNAVTPASRALCSRGPPSPHLPPMTRLLS